MNKIIAVWGCPNSGKTTFTTRLAKEIYNEYRSQIICVFADSATPTLPVLFPNKKAEDMRSIGAVLSQTEITQDTVLKNLITTDTAKNIGFMGYIDNENRWSYPEYSKEKAEEFFNTANSIADVVIVDCGNKLSGKLAFSAVNKADAIFKICKPDLKAISFFSSQTPLYDDIKYRADEHLTVLNVTEQEIYMPIEEAAQHFGCEKLILPYTNEIKQQTMNGEFFGKISNKNYKKSMKKIMEKVVCHE